MDPLSILLSSITLIGASIKVAESIVVIISSIRHRSDELLATSNDVTDFSLVLMEIHDASVREERTLTTLRVGEPGQSLLHAAGIATANPQAQAMLKRARDKLIEIEDLSREAHAAHVSKKVLLLRMKLLATDKLRILRGELRDIKLNISSYFSIKGRQVHLGWPISLSSLKSQRLTWRKFICICLDGHGADFISHSGY